MTEQIENLNTEKTQQIDPSTQNDTNFSKQTKKIFGLKMYEFVLLSLDIISVLCVFIFFEKNWLSFSCALVGCFAILFLAKGFFFAPAVNAIYDILYIILTFTENKLGAMYSYILITLPIDIYVSFTWKKQEKNSSVIKINKIHKKEWIYFGVISAIMTIVTYFVLKFRNSDDLILETLDFMTIAMAGYMLIRKNNSYSLIYSINSAISVIVWTLTAIHGNMSALAQAVNFTFNFMIESYGYFNLKRELKRQSQKKQNETHEESSLQGE